MCSASKWIFALRLFLAANGCSTNGSSGALGSAPNVSGQLDMGAKHISKISNL
jgi:hypothetical protein